MLRLNLLNRLGQLRASRWAKPLGLVWLITCLAAGGYCITRPQADANTSNSASHVTRAIETIQVGERVVTPQTVPGVSLPTAVDPTRWKLVSLQMETRYPGGLVDTMRVQTLQPPSWLSEHQVRVGARVPIPLDLKEMGVQDQLAEVTGVSACPPIETGPGRVVLTTVNHLNNFLFDLSVRGPRAQPSQITVTGWHKLYSEDRAAWVSVCKLKPDEKLRGRAGPLKVTSLSRHRGAETVYNMTVEGEHQYYVADAELLAHNTGCGPTEPTGPQPPGTYPPSVTSPTRPPAATGYQGPQPTGTYPIVTPNGDGTWTIQFPDPPETPLPPGYDGPNPIGKIGPNGAQ